MGSPTPHRLYGASLPTLCGWSDADIRYILDIAIARKQAGREGLHTYRPRLTGYSVALLFEKSSTRTRCALETAAIEEGMGTTFLSSAHLHSRAKEPLEDLARVVGRMYHAVAFRGFSQKTVELLMQYTELPVYNCLTDEWHPTQALADLLTIEEIHGTLEGCTLAYVGDGRNNVARSLIVAGTKMNMNVRIGAPAALQPHHDLHALIMDSPGSLQCTTEAEEAVAGADVVYTDVWASMGEEEKKEERENLLSPYRVDERLMRSADADALFFHCLPAIRGEEVTAEVIDGPRSHVWDQAENRKHIMSALFLATLCPHF